MHEILLPAIIIVILVLSSSVHEAAHAWVAYRCGDDTAKREGRMTLNPIVHIDPFMSVILPVTLWVVSGGSAIFGGARPVPVQPMNLRSPSRDMMFVALAGPISNILQALLLAGIHHLVIAFTDYPDGSLIHQALYYGVLLNVLLAIFNMIPIPPLDGSRVLRHVVPAEGKQLLDSVERFGIIVVIAVIYLVPGAGELIGKVLSSVTRFVYSVTKGYPF